ncbi:hypothetical protein Daus18300_010464 [Diaporthe australafricana]|uniref:Amidase domain-containing protein n=1 Tax=Diaporthe australafricana TaxID=127596 RepID=A0ABR3WAC7_9PEZI
MALSKISQATALNALKASSVVSLGGISYFVGNTAEVTKDAVLKKFVDFAHRDDVFHKGFAEGSILILRSDVPSASTPPLPQTLTEHLSLTSSKLLFVSSDPDELPDGPYFLEKPLNGLRVTMKDNYKLSGVVQTMGSRSFARLYGPQTQTADVVRTLIDLGAVIVGTTKLGAYAGSEVPPEKCVDYFPPWNPRGDGHQGPSGSSSGAGSTVASYGWIDIGIRTDSTGSIRMPAASYGLWGLRSTWSSFKMDGIVANAPFVYFCSNILGILVF